MKLEWEYKGRKLQIDTKKTFYDNMPYISEMSALYGADITREAVELIIKIAEMLEPEREFVVIGREVVEVSLAPYWFIWIPSKGISLPFICTTSIDEVDALKYLESFKKSNIPLQKGTKLVLFKFVKAIEFR